MDGLEFYTPPDVPPQVSAFDSDVRQLGVGKSGKMGLLQLEFQRDGSGKTIVRDQHSRIPLHSQRALHYDGSGMAYLYIVSASSGILQGDRYRIDIEMGRDTSAHITTQGATRIYGMNSSNATQMTNITLEEGAYLEFVPDQIIPYRNSRFYQKTALNIHESATMVYSEIVTPGRVAMGELFEYDVCNLKTVATDQHENCRIVDIANIEPKKQRLSSFGILGEHRIVGTAYVLTKKEHVPELYEGISSVLSDAGGVFGGVTVTRNDSGLLVRMLGDQTERVRETIYGIAGMTRKAVTGMPFSPIRKS